MQDNDPRVVGVFAATGCGKTTLLRHLLGRWRSTRPRLKRRIVVDPKGHDYRAGKEVTHRYRTYRGLQEALLREHYAVDVTDLEPGQAVEVDPRAHPFSVSLVPPNAKDYEAMVYAAQLAAWANNCTLILEEASCTSAKRVGNDLAGPLLWAAKQGRDNDGQGHDVGVYVSSQLYADVHPDLRAEAFNHEVWIGRLPGDNDKRALRAFLPREWAERVPRLRKFEFIRVNVDIADGQPHLVKVTPKGIEPCS